MFIVISDNFVGRVNNLHKGPKTTKGHFPILTDDYKTAILSVYKSELKRDQVFAEIESLVSQAPGKVIVVDFKEDVCGYGGNL